MSALRTVDQVYEAGADAARDHPPFTEAQVTWAYLLVAACKPPKVKAA